ncbi:ATP-binding protein [Paractinoplanes deccanensis]|uniref:ATP-binding protein n=1 Tax=Paractinoplanes deccanensis TaxID=113561 RepID=A0ABQ3Y510_9ACTN|nr:ATPase [Actinoplanes deccanensis]GID75066.1 ATP-binding protein [Actinoplanes deccanensis]
MTIAFQVTGDGRELLVEMIGRLGLTDVADVHVRLLKALAEQPQSLLIDLSGMTVEEPLALAVFTAASRQAARWPGIPLLLCTARPPVHALLTGPAYHRLPVFDSLGTARAHARDHGGETMPAISDDLLPITGAPRHARDVATDACLRWDEPGLVGPASLIASELVSNVVDHAHTMMTLRLSLRRRYLNIAVRDGSPAEPTRPLRVPGRTDLNRGRGLLLVDASSHAWGWVPSADGKVVWASLARPRS